MARNSRKEKTIAYLVYPGVSALELVGTFAIGQSFKMSRAARYMVTTVAERAEPITTDTPLGMIPATTFAELPNPWMLFVMGGGLSTLFALGNQALLDYVRQAAKTAELIAGISTGALILAAAGLLEGRPASTHWAYGQILERLGARFVRSRWIEDGKVITTAGGTGGIDMGIELVAKKAGKKLAKMMQLMAEYDPEPLFGNLDWDSIDLGALAPILADKRSELKQALANQPEIFAAIEGWMLEAASERN